MTRLFALLACVLLATGLTAQTEPELQKLEQIVAVVGNEIVLQSDVDAQVCDPYFFITCSTTRLSAYYRITVGFRSQARFATTACVDREF